MAKKNRTVRHDEHMDESWLIPYADLMTLLLALFIVLFATSSVSSEKYAAMAQAFSQAVGIMSNSNDILDHGGDNISPLEPGFIGDEEVPGFDDKDNDISNEEPKKQSVRIANLEDTFRTYVIENQLEEEMSVSEKGEGLLITLTSDIWFDTGKADITQKQMNTVREVAAMILDNQKNMPDFKVIVTGHTDNVPIYGGTYKSNWQLSVARAVNFMEALIETSALDPQNFSARGMGEYDPIDTNDTAEGRQHNRRVEVYITTE